MTEITLEQLNTTDTSSFIAALGDIYEHSPWVAEAAFAARPFRTLPALHEAMVAAVTGADVDRQVALINAHPDLAGKAARAGSLTADSTAEQASVGLNHLSDEEFERFHRLNDAYKSKFGIPFVICVRRHTKPSILRQFETRLQHDTQSEREAALAEIFRIAALRLDQRVRAPERLKVYGRLSTHVLDTQIGKPAASVAISLFDISDGNAHLLASAVTNTDGRADKPLIAERPIPIGTYELRFSVGDYFARLGVPAADPPFLDVVPLRFSVADPEGHYHVPLLVTPWSYATYRGS